MPSENRFTPLLHKDATESNNCSDKKAVWIFFGILSKDHSRIDPGDQLISQMFLSG
jgi:hypothetical protein